KGAAPVEITLAGSSPTRAAPYPLPHAPPLSPPPNPSPRSPPCPAAGLRRSPGHPSMIRLPLARPRVLCSAPPRGLAARPLHLSADAPESACAKFVAPPPPPPLSPFPPPPPPALAPAPLRPARAAPRRLLLRHAGSAAPDCAPTAVARPRAACSAPPRGRRLPPAGSASALCNIDLPEFSFSGGGAAGHNLDELEFCCCVLLGATASGLLSTCVSA
uniref:Uncharacterized protein n=4 Tax=Aegilops tauschii subsp. strangulata TaxID=200361 RepID=A0A453N4H4_AEGTS